jgi:Peptidase family M28
MDDKSSSAAANLKITRRNFLRTASALAAATAVFSGCEEDNTFPDSRAMVASPESRFEYLKVLLDEICSQGPRPIGSLSHEHAADIIKRELERALPDVSYDTFEFERWQLTARAEFRIGDTPLETFPSHGSRGTGRQGVRGFLRRTGEPQTLPYVIVGPDGDKPLAYVSLSEYGRAVALPYYSFGQELKCPPIFNIGRQDIPLLDEAVEKQSAVSAVSLAEFTPGVQTSNVVGRLPGQSREEVVFLAHLDTVYNSPGASDNTASVIAMLMIAHAFSGARNDKTMTFVATTGEEYGKLGAINYARRRREEGTFGNIRFLINLDSVTWGPDFKIYTADEDLLKMILNIDSRLDIPGAPRWEGRDGFMLDGDPFRDDAIRAVYVNSGGYHLTQLWHRPEDVPRHVPADCVENWFLLFKEYSKRLMSL